MKKWLMGIFVFILVIAGIGYTFRKEILLEYIGFRAKQFYDVGPYQEVSWSRGSSEIKKEDRPPNIVLIVADDLGWNDVTLNGGGVASGAVPTPNIDSIATDGVQFTNGYAAHSTCAPSRAALMTGRYPTRFGFEFTPTVPQMQQVISKIADPQPGEPERITYFDERKDQSVPYEEMGVPTEEVTMAEALQSSGYHTVHIGKWHLGQTNGMAPHDQGFNESLMMRGMAYLPEDNPDVVNSKQDFDPIDRFLWKAAFHAASFNESNAFKPGGYLTDYYTDEAVKVIEANKDRPFFLYLAHWAVHTPLQATRADYGALSHIKNHRLRVYAAMTRALDRSVGRVLDALKENGLEENTLVMFTSDNGGAGYIGLPEVNQPFRGWKLTFFEGGIHVPYFMRWPGRIPAGLRFDKPVHHFDIFATAVAAAGGKVSEEHPIDGVDLLPFLSPSVKSAPHDRLFWRADHYQVALVGDWKLQRADRPDKVWLYNLKTDPTEQKNVADQYPDQVQKMLKMLDVHNAAQMKPAWPSMMEGPIRIDKTSADPWEKDDEYVYVPN